MTDERHSDKDERDKIIALANEVDQIGEALMSTNMIRGQQLVSLGARIALLAGTPLPESLALATGAAGKNDGSEVDLVFTADAIYVDTGVRSPEGGNKALKVKDEQAKRLLEAIRAPLSERGDSEYICKCGVRITPHRCSTGTDF